jgi:hypothetical protein
MDKVTNYDVTLDQSEMNFEKAGPLFSRYVLKLIGPVDRRWVDCYGQILKERPNLARFRLEPATSSVSFTCRSTDGPAEVMGVVKRLQELVAMVNDAGNAALRAEQQPTNVRPHPSAPKSPASKPEAERPSLAAGLLARFSRR